MTDIFRDTWVRYLAEDKFKEDPNFYYKYIRLTGYANEVGESFRPLVDPKIVRYSYGVAFAYVCADTVDKSFKMLRKDGRPTKVLIATGDALIWQTLASVVIPGYTINRICAGSQYLLAKYSKNIPSRTRSWITVFVGLASIPFIVTPIDRGTDLFMDLTYRKIFGS